MNYMKYLKHCFDWNSEKIDRKDWWLSLLLLIVMSTCVTTLCLLLGPVIHLLVSLIALIVYIYCFVNISRKRLKDVGLNPYLNFILLIPTGNMAIVILCGCLDTNFIHDASHKKLAKKILLFPMMTSLILIILWGIVAFISAMMGAEPGDLITKVIPFLLGLSIVMILPCLIVFLALRSK